MGYYTYETECYPADVDLGAAGDCEIDVYVSVEIRYEDIINEMGDDVWKYVAGDIEDHIINNHTDYMQGIVENACTGGLEDLVDCLVQRYKENGEEEELQHMIRAATKAIHELNDVEQGELL